MHGRDAATLTALAAASLMLPPGHVATRYTASLPVVAPNDNRHAAGIMRGDTLFVDLEIRMARWYPEATDGEFIETPVIGEVGHAPAVPGPLIRVREGTTIVARLINNLTDSTVTWTGLSRKPSRDSVALHPGESTTLRFGAGQAGTYFYSARAGTVDWKVREREQTIGAFVIDPPGARTDDRIFVLNIWSETIDSITSRNALAINGRGWPYTERIEASRGDTLRWRIINGTNRPHPMHLHGFYYDILSRGDGERDTELLPRDRETVVTERMKRFTTMTMRWVPEREGNWLFHCHLSFHVNAEARYATGVSHEDHMSGDAMRHMAGLVLGIDVRPRGIVQHDSRAGARQLRLLVQEGPRRGRAPRALGFVLQKDAPPAPDSIEIAGTPLVLTRGQPTDITVVNHLREATAVHWHGIELESWSDGVAGWSGAMKRLAPPIAPRDSFVAHLTLKRAGTFIYHTHLNDVEQLTSGLYGALVVLEPGRRFDATTDHLFVVGWDGPEDPPHLLVNGDSAPPPLVLAAGRHHRLRFVFIGAVGGEVFSLRRGADTARWTPVARDGFSLPAAQRAERPAKVQGWAGQTYDYDFNATQPGEYALVADDDGTIRWTGRIVVH